MLGRSHERRRPVAESGVAVRVVVDPVHDWRREPRVRRRAVRDQRLDDVRTVERVVGLGIRPAHGLGQRVHVDRRVQRGHARGLGDVRIGALVDQQAGEIEMQVDDRRHQRARAVGIGPIQVGAGLGERPRRVDGALPRGIHQRRPSSSGQDRRPRDDAVAEPELGKRRLVRLRVDVGAMRDQHLDGVRVIFDRRPHQRGLSQHAFLRVHVGAVIEQHRHHGRVAAACGGHQNRLVFRQAGVRVRARRQQRVDDGNVAVQRRQRQRRHAVPIRRFRVRARAQQQLDRLEIVRANRPMQRRRPIGLRCIDRGGLFQQRAQRGVVPRLCGLDQRGIRRRRAGDRRSDQRPRSWPGATRRLSFSLPSCSLAIVAFSQK